MPRFSLLPSCCCVQPTRRSKNQKSNRVPVVNGNQHFAIPKVMVNGRVAMGGQRRVSTASEPVVIEMSEEFTTARTSRDHCNNFLSMKELIRVVRSEEGLLNRPRQDYQAPHEPIVRYMKRPLEVGKRFPEAQPGPSAAMMNQRRCISPSSPTQTLDIQQLSRREQTRRERHETFYIGGDITSRTSSTARISSGKRCMSVATISGENYLILPQPPPAPSALRYLITLPQMFIAIISISLGWLANLVSFILRM